MNSVKCFYKVIYECYENLELGLRKSFFREWFLSRALKEEMKGVVGGRGRFIICRKVRG